MTITKQPFGTTKNGQDVDVYTLTQENAKGQKAAVDIITYGAAIRSICIPDGSGGMRDVALGFDNIEGYEANKGFHGAVIGRIGNRVANAVYTMNEKTYKLDMNDGDHSLHGGFIGFDKQVWDAKIIPAPGPAKDGKPGSGQAEALELTLLDREGTAAGYPGDMTAAVRYSLTADGEAAGFSLGIEYTATCTEDTPVNMTNHCYFNLKGQGSGSIAGHTLQILSSKITAIDSTLIPTGELMDVTDTPFDLRGGAEISKGYESPNEQIKYGGGYDHNWVLSLEAHRDKPATAAVLSCGAITMECLTTKPGIQFYSGNMMAGETGKGGAVYSKRTGLCLETQYWPNSVNMPEFPAPLLRRGETYSHKTIYRFSSK